MITAHLILCLLAANVLTGLPTKEDCLSPPDTGSSACAGARRRYRYYYKTSTGRCSYFLYKGCGGNGNNYQSRALCNRACDSTSSTKTKSSLSKDCSLSTDAGRSGSGCRRSYKYYYDTATKKCKFFRYNGCGGNGNNFPSRAGCNRFCASTSSLLSPVRNNEDCLLPKDLGDTGCGRRSGYRYYYDKRTKRCNWMHYKGCGGNENNYRTRTQCNSVCASRSSLLSPVRNKKDCSSNKDPGNNRCGARAGYRYYYDTARRSCNWFRYQGCGGNENNYRTRTECNSVCASRSSSSSLFDAEYSLEIVTVFGVLIVLNIFCIIYYLYNRKRKEYQYEKVIYTDTVSDNCLYN